MLYQSISIFKINLFLFHEAMFDGRNKEIFLHKKECNFSRERNYIVLPSNIAALML